MAPTIVLISGANRGLGKGLLERYLTTPDHTVIAANRDPEHPTSKALASLPKASGSRLITVKVDSGSSSDALEAVKELQEQGIDHLDVVIANAGIIEKFVSVEEVSIDDLNRHMNVNVYGVIRLYQATIALLRKGTNPKFITIGSIAGSMARQPPTPNCLYGPSKAAVHWVTTRINGEEETVTSFVLHPGWAQSDMGVRTASIVGIEKAPVTIEDSCDGMIKVINEATKQNSGGKLLTWEGEEEAW